jgi:hypothetical protein
VPIAGRAQTTSTQSMLMPLCIFWPKVRLLRLREIKGPPEIVDYLPTLLRLLAADSRTVGYTCSR